MDIILSILIWAIIIVLAVYLARIIIGAAIWFIIGLIWLVVAPVIWISRKFKGE